MTATTDRDQAKPPARMPLQPENPETRQNSEEEGKDGEWFPRGVLTSQGRGGPDKHGGHEDRFMEDQPGKANPPLPDGIGGVGRGLRFLRQGSYLERASRTARRAGVS